MRADQRTRGVGGALPLVGGSPDAERVRSHQQPTTANRQPASKGFTLLEVLVGLLVLALALLALTRTAAIQVQAFSGLRERTVAGWLAADVLAETRLASAFPATGKSDGKRKFGGRDWRWELNVEATDVVTIRRLDVHIYKAIDNATPLVELVGFSGQDLQQ